MSSSCSACQARATPHCPTPCPPSIRPRRTLPLGIDKPNRARRTPQIPGSQPERASGVLNSIGNLEALSEPQAAWASGEARVRISNLRLPNGHEMVGNRQSPAVVAARCMIHAITGLARADSRLMVRLLTWRIGRRGGVGCMGTCCMDEDETLVYIPPWAVLLHRPER